MYLYVYLNCCTRANSVIKTQSKKWNQTKNITCKTRLGESVAVQSWTEAFVTAQLTSATRLAMRFHPLCRKMHCCLNVLHFVPFMTTTDAPERLWLQSISFIRGAWAFTASMRIVDEAFNFLAPWNSRIGNTISDFPLGTAFTVFWS